VGLRCGLDTEARGVSEVCIHRTALPLVHVFLNADSHYTKPRTFWNSEVRNNIAVVRWFTRSLLSGKRRKKRKLGVDDEG
jgi:hypothetical protein